ncbi:MAG: putative DNA binding domain-containing protein [Clostridiales Family XIII bacterium]|jgi:ATP-dependent DNA helicase RecG|nr:putative DNA binding domain-containing protein [Clostridiales Family XIII bacterium]
MWIQTGDNSKMTPEQIRQLLSEGEGLTIEYKECINELSNSVFETVSSFSNRYGGHLILGADDEGVVLGVNPKAAPSMKKNFINMLSNPQKISPTLLLDLEDVELDGKLLLYVYIPASSQVELCSNKIYDRVGDADIDITKSTDLAADLYGRKSAAYTEREIFPYVTENEMRLDLVERAQRMSLGENRDHPWKGLSPLEVMKSAGLYDEDWRTGKKGFNLAGILLFGRDDVIRSCAPGYETDALVRREDVDRYDDRLIVGTNLIEAYEMLTEFIAKHTQDRFFLVDNQRVSVRSWIARELVSNILTHREYSKGFPAKIVIESDRIYAENWNRSNRHGRIDPEHFTPDPKNPIIARFFVNIGRADKLGSGVRNLYKYTKIYSGGEPELIEGEVFKTIVPLNGIGASGFTGDGIGNGTAIPNTITKAIPNAITNNETRQRLIAMIENDPSITSKLLGEKLGISERNIKTHIKTLKDAGFLVRIGGTRGHWEVIANSGDEK